MAAPVKTELSPEVRLYACARAAHYLGYWLYPLREADIEEEEEKFEHMLYDVKLFLREAEKYCGVDMSEARRHLEEAKKAWDRRDPLGLVSATNLLTGAVRHALYMELLTSLEKIRPTH
jgi:hypothetical protein